MCAYTRPALIDADGKAQHLVSTKIDLLTLIFEHPQDLPAEAGKLEPICRNLPTVAGPLDIFLMTANGDLVFVVQCNGAASNETLAKTVAKVEAVFALGYGGLTAAATQAGCGGRLAERFDADETAFSHAVGRNLKCRQASLIAICDRAPEAFFPPPSIALSFWTVQAFKLPSGEVLICPFPLSPAPAMPDKECPLTTATFLKAMGNLHPELPNRLQAFLKRLEQLDIRCTFGSALTLIWDAPDGQAVALAHITPFGLVWTDAGVAKLTVADATVLAHRYVERLAIDLGLTVNRTAFGETWTLRDYADRIPNIKDMVYALDTWADAIEPLVSCLRLRIAAGQ